MDATAVLDSLLTALRGAGHISIVTVKRSLRKLLPKPTVWYSVTIAFKQSRFEAPKDAQNTLMLDMRDWAIETLDECIVFKDMEPMNFNIQKYDKYTTWFRTEESATAFALRWSK